MSESNDSISQVLVFGASGYIGTNLVERLMQLPLRVRASARNPDVLQGRGWHGVELVQADALKPETLTPALDDVDVAYYLVHSMAAGRGFARLDREAADNFSRAAAEAGVRRIVYLGGLAPSQPVSEHLRSRRETGERLRTGTVPVTEIRAGMIVGPGSAAFEVVRDLVNHLPVMLTPRWVRSRSSPIALENLMEYLLRVPHMDQTAGNCYDVGGPEVLSYEDIMRQYADVVGKHPVIITVPVLSPRLSSYWLHLVTSVPAPIAGALIEGLKQDVIADDAQIRQLIPQKLLTFREAVLSSLEHESGQQTTSRWVEGSIVCRNYHPEYGFYAKRASGSAVSSASAAELWRQITAIGGDRGYYYLNGLWTVRRAIDWLVGGPSFRRRRRHAAGLRVGDVIDAWRVIAVEPETRLTLLMEMKAPGAGVLEFDLKAEPPAGHRITATAYFHPAGFWGLLYWYLLAPAHWLIFRGLTRAISTRATAAERRSEAH